MCFFLDQCRLSDTETLHKTQSSCLLIAHNPPSLNRVLRGAAAAEEGFKGQRYERCYSKCGDCCVELALVKKAQNSRTPGSRRKLKIGPPASPSLGVFDPSTSIKRICCVAGSSNLCVGTFVSLLSRRTAGLFVCLLGWLAGWFLTTGKVLCRLPSAS